MNFGALEKDYASVTSNYSQLDQRNTTQNYGNPNQTSLLNSEFSQKGYQNFDRNTLKNLSNEELDKLIQMKNHSIEKFQPTPTPVLQNPRQHDYTNTSLTSSGRKISNSNVNNILNKYNLSNNNDERSTYDQRPIDSNFTSNQDTVPAHHGLPSLHPTFTTAGFDVLKKGLEQAAKMRNIVDPLKENPFISNAPENPYLSNLESSIDRSDFQQKYASKDNEGLSFNQDYLLNRDPQLTASILENSPLRSSGNRPNNKENIMKALSRGQLTPKQLPKPSRIDTGSPAIAGAMKALQDKLGNADAELEELRKKVSDLTMEKQREVEEQRRKLQKEMDAKHQEEAELRKQMDNVNNQNFQLQSEITRLKSTNQTSEEQLQRLREELARTREDLKIVQTENSVMKKEVVLVENEKNLHLEQNANDRDIYEERLKNVREQLEREQEKREQLERYKEDAEITRAELEHELRKITHEAAMMDKHTKERIKSLEIRLEEAVKQGQAYYEDFNISTQKFEKERAILQKKATEADRKIEAVMISYEEKLEMFKEENKDLKKAYNAQQTELTNLKKKFAQVEKANTKLEADKTEKDKIVRQLMDMTDELVRKMKKDPNNAALQNILFKKKKIEQDLQAKRNERSVSKGNRSARKGTTISTSRSPSNRKGSASFKGHLSMEDLNITHDDSKVNIPSSRKSAKKLSNSINRLASPMAKNKAVTTPIKGKTLTKTKSQKSSTSLAKKDKLADLIRGAELSAKNDPISGIHYPLDETPSNHNFTGKFGVPTTFSHESAMKLLTSINSTEQLGASKATVADNNNNPQVVSFNPERAKLSIDVDKMTSNEVSSEIVKLEREVSELKREYKNLLAKAQNQNAEDINEVKQRLNQVANDLQEKSEVHLLLKKKQRELLAKNL